MSAGHKEAMDGLWGGAVLPKASWSPALLLPAAQDSVGTLHRILGWTNGYLMSTDPQEFTKVCKPRPSHHHLVSGTWGRPGRRLIESSF